MQTPDIFGGLFELESPAQPFPLSAIWFARGFNVVRVRLQGDSGIPQTASLRPFAPSDESIEVLSIQLNTDSTYLITGGSRGIGLEIASWMVEHGARHLLLVARNSLPFRGTKDAHTDILLGRMADMEAQGAAIHVVAIDLSLPGADAALGQAIENLQIPDVKGVVHAAGTAGYHTLETCTTTDIENIFAPNIRGALSLDALFPPGTLSDVLRAGKCSPGRTSNLQKKRRRQLHVDSVDKLARRGNARAEQVSDTDDQPGNEGQRHRRHL
ncbi:KR domain-containing protein [Aspergillus crustosus]